MAVKLEHSFRAFPSLSRVCKFEVTSLACLVEKCLLMMHSVNNVLLSWYIQYTAFIPTQHIYVSSLD